MELRKRQTHEPPIAIQVDGCQNRRTGRGLYCHRWSVTLSERQGKVSWGPALELGLNKQAMKLRQRGKDAALHLLTEIAPLSGKVPVT